MSMTVESEIFATWPTSLDQNHTLLNLRLNGVLQRFSVAPDTLLLDLLREEARLTGAKRGCEMDAPEFQQVGVTWEVDLAPGRTLETSHVRCIVVPKARSSGTDLF